MDDLQNVEDKIKEVLDISKDSADEDTQKQQVIIHNVKYLLEEASISNEITSVAATETYTNDSEEIVDASVKLSYEETRSYSWNFQSSKPAVPIKIKAELPVIRNGKVELSESSNTNWEQKEVFSNQVDATYKIKVPPLKKVTVDLIVTTAECDIPFSYAQTETLEDSEEKNCDMEDGIYHGVMDSFHFNNYETKEEDS